MKGGLLVWSQPQSRTPPASPRDRVPGGRASARKSGQQQRGKPSQTDESCLARPARPPSARPSPEPEESVWR